MHACIAGACCINKNILSISSLSGMSEALKSVLPSSGGGLLTRFHSCKQPAPFTTPFFISLRWLLIKALTAD